ncbi:MAG: hypothetical protein V8S08_10205 [Lachnoclostridium sp.]
MSLMNQASKLKDEKFGTRNFYTDVIEFVKDDDDQNDQLHQDKKKVFGEGMLHQHGADW